MTGPPRDAGRPRPRRAGPAAALPFVYVFAAVRRPPSARWLAALPTLPSGRPPRPLSVARDLALIVADVPQALYAPAVLEPRLADADWVSSAAAAHHGVIDRIARRGSLLPCRIFTIFSSDDRARAALAPKAARLRRALQDLDGRQEWVLRIGLPDPSRATARTPSPRLDRRGPATGTGFLQQKAAAARERRARTDRVRAETAAVAEALERVADRASARPAPDGTSLVLDAAYLVQTRRLAAFRRTLATHAPPLLAEGCPVSLTGPWPPYSFASID